ncbi:hypothetical protein HPP92_004980 [Vanilla planifolia]|uniref:Uncharacterized protein n=1 Tax=Vanilla planifolia TaxID=51239 RepID=A0A835RKU8_VANPL|nr:hypothetical protein HPP92_004980 [Vanilla planifolia]
MPLAPLTPAGLLLYPHHRVGVVQCHTRIRDASRLGNPTRANTEFRASGSSPAALRRTRRPRASSSSSDTENGRFGFERYWAVQHIGEACFGMASPAGGGMEGKKR